MYENAFAVFPTLETERLLLRQLEISDADDIFDYAKNKEDFIYTDGFPHEYEEVKFVVDMWRNDAYASKQFIRWGIVFKAENKMIGGVYLFLPQGNDSAGRIMDIGIDIAHNYWSKGFATEAIECASRYALSNMDLRRVQAQVVPENIGSIRAFEKAGFSKEGTLRNFCHYKHNGNSFRTMVMLSRIPDDLR